VSISKIVLQAGLLSLLVLAPGCATFDRQDYHRIAVVNLFSDSVTVRQLANFFAFPDEKPVPVAGVRQRITEAAKRGLERNGFEVVSVPVDPDLFFARAEAFDNKPRSFWTTDLPAKSGVTQVVDNMIADGTIDRNRVDMVLLIGPAVPFGEVSLTLGQNGPGLQIFHQTNHPHEYSVFLSGVASGIDVRTGNPVRGVPNIQAGDRRPTSFPDIDSATQLTAPEHRSELMELLDKSLNRTFGLLLK
jgi:hypothetical protein